MPRLANTRRGIINSALHRVEDYLDDMSMDDWIQTLPLILVLFYGLSTLAPNLSKSIEKDIFGEPIEEAKKVTQVQVTTNKKVEDPKTGEVKVVQVTETKELSVAQGLVQNYDNANMNLWKFILHDHCKFGSENKSIIQMAASTKAENNPALNPEIVQRVAEIWNQFGPKLWTDTKGKYLYSNIYFTRGGLDSYGDMPLFSSPEYNFKAENDAVPEISKLVHPELHDSAITFAIDKESKEMVWMEIKQEQGQEPRVIIHTKFGPNDQLLLLTRTKHVRNNESIKNIAVDVIFHDIRNSQREINSHIRAIWHKRFFFEVQNFFVNRSNELIVDAQKKAGKSEICDDPQLVEYKAKDGEDLKHYDAAWLNVRDYLKLVMLAGFFRYFMWRFKYPEGGKVMLFTNSGPGGTPIPQLINMYRNPIPKGSFKNPENEHIDLNCSPEDLASGHCFHQTRRQSRRRRSRRQSRRQSRRRSRRRSRSRSRRRRHTRW